MHRNLFRNRGLLYSSRLACFFCSFSPPRSQGFWFWADPFFGIWMAKRKRPFLCLYTLSRFYSVFYSWHLSLLSYFLLRASKLWKWWKAYSATSVEVAL